MYRASITLLCSIVLSQKGTLVLRRFFLKTLLNHTTLNSPKLLLRSLLMNPPSDGDALEGSSWNQVIQTQITLRSLDVMAAAIVAGEREQIPRLGFSNHVISPL
ncbi:hypothetical protein Pyn_36943 [Prunus yedoensis var. nudiflora]|uniref:Uncharacterized protein n=1 Tax=Prunus yedoensis var. nudiflora TaxID=2094558 RepID=A0A314Y6Y6_PRUYE|nr:hypothetical protein Pyn_36943 [Prunus yedoensis var. nudiflora]